MFSLAATPLSELANTSLLPDSANLLSTFGSYANRPAAVATLAEEALPPGVPFPAGTQFSVNGQGDPSSSSPTAGFPGFAGMPFRPGTAGGANSLGNPVFANQQPAPLSVQQPAASESMPLAPAAQNDWSIFPSPNAPPAQTYNALLGTTCVSASDCWAVGYYVAGGATQTLIERWDGTAWAIVTSPNTGATQTNVLYSVTCVSASQCWAVGFYLNDSARQQPLIERWDGTSWAIVTSPSTSAAQHNVLFGVTCVSASQCWAVGAYDNTTTTAYQTLIERWDGTSWAIVGSPNNINPTKNSVLLGIKCASASDCWAVGYYDTTPPVSTGTINQTLIEHWDGTSWTIVTSPNTSPTQNNILRDVRCLSASDCWAIGGYVNGIPSQALIAQTLIEHWNGASWTIVISPNTSPAQNNILNGVTCVSASKCWAFGYYDNTAIHAYQTLIELWDGTSWAIVTSANTSAAQDNILYGVTCLSASNCWAVGAYSNGRVFQTLTERWDGTSWAVVGSPSIVAQLNNFLYGVTCVSAFDCWAVGISHNGDVFQTLIERWNGASWTTVTSPNTSAAKKNVLKGVTCVSASSCWAVGYYDNGSVNQTLIERWDGTSWAIVTSPNTSATQSNFLWGVTCGSASDCWAVGYYKTASVNQTLIERWDGASWTIVTSPNNSATQNNFLYDVTCVSASNCWAVGNNGSTSQTLIERWNGTAWAIVTSPNTSTAQSNFLIGVTCASASDCWAVGYYLDASSVPVVSVFQTLIEHWDGASWAIVTSPSSSIMENNFLEGVTCASASECWAVGTFAKPGATASPTLIERWDGTSWAIVISPNIGATVPNVLFGVTCTSASACWAAGYYGNGATLVLRYGSIPPIPTSVVSRKTHGTAGDFDIDLPLAGNPGIECRTGGTNNDYQMVVTFANAVTFSSAAVTSGTGSVASTGGSGTPAITVNLTGVTNAQTITLTLSGVNDGNNTGDIGIHMGVLVGDTTGNGSVNSSDISQTKAQSGTVANSSNFRTDVTVNGLINSSDISTVKSKSGTALP